jgi:hypothetical protein
MSLVTTASLWTNEDNSSRKRAPSMRRTIRKTRDNDDSPAPNDNKPIVIENDTRPRNDTRPLGFDEEQQLQDARTERVSQLINDMSNLSEQNDGNQLVDFNPISPPNMQKKIDTDTKVYGRTGEEEIMNPSNQIYSVPKRLQPGESNYAPSLPDLGVSNNPYRTNPYSNYRRIYEQPHIQPSRYGNVETNPQSSIDNRLLEKINYMIHMLEQKHNEKTTNITEEFILYTFLGVFIIFVVDSFARSGKYTR